ncbi:MAG: phenylacetate--CoA ligase, partial [Xanthobacteraceae bacterium]
MGDVNQIEPIEKASIDALRALQVARLKSALHTCYERVPHYRRKFDAAGVHPSDLKQLDDLARFPFTSKDDL